MNRATRVCLACRKRKRACDKALPRCSFCVDHGLPCSYDYDKAPNLFAGNGNLALGLGSPPVPAALSVADQVQVLLLSQSRSPSQVISDFIICRHQSPILLFIDDHSLECIAADTTDDTASILLLAMCLVTEHSSDDSLYSALRLLVVQVQITQGFTLTTAQANVLLTCYEFARGWMDACFVSLGCCARMAYSLESPQNIACRGRRSKQLLSDTIVLLDSLIGSDLAQREREQSPISLQVCAAASIDVDPALDDGPDLIGLLIHAASLLRRVVDLKILRRDTPMLSEVAELDDELQAFLFDIMKEQQQDPQHNYCDIMAITFNALFTLHRWCNSLPRTPDPEPVNDRSQAALTTTVKMALQAWQHPGHCKMPIGLPVCFAANLQHTKETLQDFDIPLPPTLEIFEAAFVERWRTPK